MQAQMGIELHDDDFIWLDPSGEYGSTWDLCRPMRDADDEPIFIQHKDATSYNHFIFFDAADQVRSHVGFPKRLTALPNNCDIVLRLFTDCSVTVQ